MGGEDILAVERGLRGRESEQCEPNPASGGWDMIKNGSSGKTNRRWSHAEKNSGNCDLSCYICDVMLKHKTGVLACYMHINPLHFES